jgi:hypothetical protein
VQASGVTLDSTTLAQIDDAILGQAETDPALTVSPDTRVA